MATLTRADLLWIMRFVDNYQYLVREYPELFSKDDIDDVKVVKQLIKEKLA
jgi:hypothetical protein